MSSATWISRNSRNSGRPTPSASRRPSAASARSKGDPSASGNGETVTLRTDHIAGAAFVAFGLVVLALSGDLPFGTLSFPGAGMMPKLLAGLLIVFGVIIVLRARDSAPLADVSWSDLPHAVRVVAITAVAIALYPTLGFVRRVALVLFAVLFGAERRPVLAAAAFAVGAVALSYLLFAVLLKTPLVPGVLGF